MRSYIFKAAYGEEDKTVEISDVSGTGGSFHLMIGNFYNGCFHISAGEWKLSTQIPFPPRTPDSEALRPSLQTEDICILEEVFKANFVENC